MPLNFEADYFRHKTRSFFVNSSTIACKNNLFSDKNSLAQIFKFIFVARPHLNRVTVRSVKHRKNHGIDDKVKR